MLPEASQIKYPDREIYPYVLAYKLLGGFREAFPEASWRK
jgi:hypothetical protein